MKRNYFGRIDLLFVLIILTLGLVVACQKKPSMADKSRSVAAVFPVTVEAFQDFQREANKVFEGENVAFHVFSAEGDPSRFQTIIDSALLKKPDVMIFVGTQLTNTGLGPRYEGHLPKVISSCISDPPKVDQLVAIGLNPPRRQPVAIVTDMPRQDSYVYSAELIRTVIPAVKHVGILFNNAEINSKNTAGKLAAALKEKGLSVLEGVVSGEEDVEKVARDLVLKGADLLVIPHDKYVIKKARSVVKIGMEAPRGPVPVFSLDDGTVRKDGAAFGVSVNYGELGAMTAKLSLKIMSGDDPASMAIIQKDAAVAYFNLQQWNRLKLPELPKNIRQKVVIYQGDTN